MYHCLEEAVANHDQAEMTRFERIAGRRFSVNTIQRNIKEVECEFAKKQAAEKREKERLAALKATEPGPEVVEKAISVPAQKAKETSLGEKDILMPAQKAEETMPIDVEIDAHTESMSNSEQVKLQIAAVQDNIAKLEAALKSEHQHLEVLKMLESRELSKAEGA